MRHTESIYYNMANVKGAKPRARVGPDRSPAFPGMRTRTRADVLRPG
jgi:hypothetical protein